MRVFSTFLLLQAAATVLANVVSLVSAGSDEGSGKGSDKPKRFMQPTRKRKPQSIHPAPLPPVPEAPEKVPSGMMSQFLPSLKAIGELVKEESDGLQSDMRDMWAALNEASRNALSLFGSSKVSPRSAPATSQPKVPQQPEQRGLPSLFPFNLPWFTPSQQTKGQPGMPQRGGKLAHPHQQQGGPSQPSEDDEDIPSPWRPFEEEDLGFM